MTTKFFAISSLLALLLCFTPYSRGLAKTFKFNNLESIELTPENHVYLSGYVSSATVEQWILKLFTLSAELSDNEPIYIVINSGGGGVIAGIDFIRAMQSVPQPVHTITLYGFSMAFTIAQFGVVRYIVEYGTLGQHRAKGRIPGQFADGELEQRLLYFTNVINTIEIFTSKRMGISHKEYKLRIKDEWYFFDYQAIEDHAADVLINISCSEDLKSCPLGT